MTTHAVEVASGERFEFGENWRRFLQQLTPERVAAAENSLRDMLDVRDLRGRSFLDIGSGSGLFSLAARRLGAHVRSFDFDPKSVACTNELRRRYFPEDPGWVVSEGSVLDREFVSSLGSFDIVYSWGVLHHTGAMWEAIDNAALAVAQGGLFFIALYNNQGKASMRWRTVKKLYNRLPPMLRPFVAGGCFVHLYARPLVRGMLAGDPLRIFRDYRGRGMSLWRDLIDWVGGYPFEVAGPGEVFQFCRARGFTLERLITTPSLGCNEFVFRRVG